MTEQQLPRLAIRSYPMQYVQQWKLKDNTPVTIRHARGESRVALDQRNATTPFVFTSVGEFHFDAGRAGSVDMTNASADGRIAVDAVRFVWRGD